MDPKRKNGKTYMEQMAKIKIDTIHRVIILVLFFFTFPSLSAQYSIKKDSIFLSEQMIEHSFKPQFKIDQSDFLKFNIFDVNKLPIFCFIEHLIEKNSSIALRFRLGDLNYVNMLENKR